MMRIHAECRVPPEPIFIRISLGFRIVEIALNGWGGLGYVSWMPDGRNLIVGHQENCCASLLSAGMAGDVRVLWKQNGGVAISGIPSPDGRRIAIWLWAMNENFWILDKPQS